MEDVLDIYARELPEDEMLICMDESTKQHIEETRMPMPIKSGEPLKYDYEYKRNGLSALFVFFLPINLGEMLLWRITNEHKSG